MHILYTRLNIHSKDSLNDIHRIYKQSAYNYLQSKDKRGLEELNEAYLILKDPYKRAFYDLFGDGYISSLTHSENAYFLSRFFTLQNMLLIFFAYMLTVLNTFFLPLVFKICANNLTRFCGFFISSLCLGCFLLNIHRFGLSKHASCVKLFPYFNCYLLICFVQMLVLTNISLPLFLFINLVVIVCLLLFKSNFKYCYVLLQVFVAFSSCAYFTEYNYLMYWAPSLACLGCFLFHRSIVLVLELLVVPICAAMYLMLETNFTVFSVCLQIYNYSIGSAFLFLPFIAYIIYFNRPNAIIYRTKYLQIEDLI